MRFHQLAFYVPIHFIYVEGIGKTWCYQKPRLMVDEVKVGASKHYIIRERPDEENSIRIMEDRRNPGKMRFSIPKKIFDNITEADKKYLMHECEKLKVLEKL